MARHITISNRLPISIVRQENGEYEYQLSAGGLATGLQSFHDQNESLWVGWPGMSIDEEADRRLVTKRMAGDNMLPVFLTQEEIDDFYLGFSNQTIWPLFHYFKQYTEYSPHYWEVYQRVNEYFAEQLLKVARPDDIFWVHDYQLMLLPQLIRDQYPDATIGFFLHIPFPSHEIFRTLPWRREILRGMLGADLIGFHTYDYVRHFLSATRRILDLEHSLGRIKMDGRVADVDSFPMGIDFEKFAKAIHEPDTIAELVSVRKNFGKEKLILSVDRLDYSKGILQRLHAFDAFLERHPEYQGQVSLITVLVPSRNNVDQYQLLKEQIDEAVGRINGKYSSPEWTAIHYFYRALPFSTLTSLYYSADIALITPFRDGMNLIAKEYVATKRDGKGVLILSEMAGAAKELTEALFINPNDIEGIADALHAALNMPVEEQQRRLSEMQSRLKRYDVTRWANLFIKRMHDAHQINEERKQRIWNPRIEQQLLSDYQQAHRRLLLLDYDGTLVGFHPNPEQAYPSRKVIGMVQALAQDAHNQVVIISGRDKTFLEKYFGELPMDIVAEHGMWLKSHTDEQPWQTIREPVVGWKAEIHKTLDWFVDRTPGSFIEEKEYSLAWHYRKVDPDLGEMRVRDLVDALSHDVNRLNLHVMEGNKVVEIKTAGVDKGNAARRWVERESWDFVMAIGDDYTDEDTFSVLDESAYTIKVGYKDSRARFNIPSVEDVHQLLDALRALDPQLQRTENASS